MIMPIIPFVVSSSDDSHSIPASPRHAFFVAQTEQEALQSLRGVYSKLFEDQKEPLGFDKEGGLDYMLLEKSRRGIKEKRKECGGIRLVKYASSSILSIRLYDEDMEPDYDNIMIAYCLAEKSKA